MTGVYAQIVESWAVNAATVTLGDLPSQFDHVMLILPPMVDFRNAAAYAYVNYWRSVFQDDYWYMVMVQMHELGHNLNLAHSGEGTSTYADHTGMFSVSALHFHLFCGKLFIETSTVLLFEFLSINLMTSFYICFEKT